MKKLHSPAGSFSTLLRPSRNESKFAMILNYAIKGPMIGSLTVAVIELFLPGWMPIGRMSMGTMLIIDVILGELTLALFWSDLPWSIIIPLQGFSTLALSVLWVYITGGKSHLFSDEMLVFVVLFIVLYICAWLVILLYSRAITEGMNQHLNARLSTFKAKTYNDGASDADEGVESSESLGNASAETEQTQYK
ncbi:hypothetical protein OZX72_07685 [Bifidobacterium sp. ESL0769]|uniref:hypothetical protein n=1 Tax=Bifidobacterium sp. ESL0769 TaxID=2983229 RepID=UPI0023F84EED|nr:hypothetical protein [Bifidobacterium sp. ESL0769]WEV67112.1 hypothetical protein OZX72_07685 [Bifidobacterium sp. ESL0769]